MRKTAPGASGPRSFYLGYVGISWIRAAARFERTFWSGLREGAATGVAFEHALLAGFDPSDLSPEWWGSYDLYPLAPSARGVANHG